MKCQWAPGGNSLKKLLASFQFPKRALWIRIQQCIYLFIYDNLLQREGRFKTRLFLHFFGGAIPAAIQIQLSVRASLNYKIIKGFGTKINVVSLLPHFFAVILSLFTFFDLFVAFSQTKPKGKYAIKLNDTGKKTRNVVEVVTSIVKKFLFCTFIFSRVAKTTQNQNLEGLCSEKRARAQIPKPGDGVLQFSHILR